MIEAIVVVVRQLERDMALVPGRGVFPWQVQSRLDVGLHEATLRRKMAQMAEAGELIRVGGAGARRGYRTRLWTREWAVIHKDRVYWERRTAQVLAA